VSVLIRLAHQTLPDTMCEGHDRDHRIHPRRRRKKTRVRDVSPAVSKNLQPAPDGRAGLRLVALVLGVGLALQACAPEDKSKSLATLQITYDEWVALGSESPPLESGQSAKANEVLREGQGPEVAVGDLVELHLRTRLPSSSGAALSERDEGLGWVWIGFGDASKSDFGTENGELAAALIGLRQGSVYTFAARDTGPHYSWERVGYATQLPFGNRQWYSQHVSHAPIDKAGRPGGGVVYADRGTSKEVTLVEITRVCKGQALQRLVSLMDNSPIQLAKHNNSIGSYESTEPRWKYLREAKWEGRCNDGAQASFQYGPYFVGTPRGKPDDTSVTTDLPWLWIKDAWSKLPVGVVVK
jgi:hypothetical protein